MMVDAESVELHVGRALESPGKREDSHKSGVSQKTENMQKIKFIAMHVPGTAGDSSRAGGVGQYSPYMTQADELAVSCIWHGRDRDARRCRDVCLPLHKQSMSMRRLPVRRTRMEVGML